MDKKFLVGFDVGGTKCAVILGAAGTDGELEFLERGVFPTAEFREPERCIEEMTRLADGMLARHELTNDWLHGLGVSCGRSAGQPRRSDSVAARICPAG